MKERYTLVVKPTFPDFANELRKFDRINCKTLREAKEWFGVLTEDEKKRSYIRDNVKQCNVDI